MGAVALAHGTLVRELTGSAFARFEWLRHELATRLNEIRLLRRQDGANRGPGLTLLDGLRGVENHALGARFDGVSHLPTGKAMRGEARQSVLIHDARQLGGNLPRWRPDRTSVHRAVLPYGAVVQMYTQGSHQQITPQVEVRRPGSILADVENNVISCCERGKKGAAFKQDLRGYGELRTLGWNVLLLSCRRQMHHVQLSDLRGCRDGDLARYGFVQEGKLTCRNSFDYTWL